MRKWHGAEFHHIFFIFFDVFMLINWWLWCGRFCLSFYITPWNLWIKVATISRLLSPWDAHLTNWLFYSKSNKAWTLAWSSGNNSFEDQLTSEGSQCGLNGDRRGTSLHAHFINRGPGTKRGGVSPPTLHSLPTSWALCPHHLALNLAWTKTKMAVASSVVPLYPLMFCQLNPGFCVILPPLLTPIYFLRKIFISIPVCPLVT